MRPIAPACGVAVGSRWAALVWLVAGMTALMVAGRAPPSVVRHITPGGHPVAVVDGAVSASNIHVLRTLLGASGEWYMAPPPSLVESPPAPLPSVGELLRRGAASEGQASSGYTKALGNSAGLQWWAGLNTSHFEQTALWSEVRAAVAAAARLAGEGRGTLHLGHVNARLVRAGDEAPAERPACGAALQFALDRSAGNVTVTDPKGRLLGGAPHDEQPLASADLGFYAVVFLNSQWGADEYGELYVLDDDATAAADGTGEEAAPPGGKPEADALLRTAQHACGLAGRHSSGRVEIGEMVSPRAGRVVVFPAHAAMLQRPPAPPVRRGQLLLRVWVTPSERLAGIGRQAQAAALRARAASRGRAWASLASDKFGGGGDVDTECHSALGSPEGGLQAPYTRARAAASLSRVIRARDGSGRKVMVFDGMLTDCDAARAVRAVLAGPEGGVKFDDSEDEGNDNVVWIAGYPADAFTRTRLFAAVTALAEFASAGRTGWFPYDVSCNHLEPGDQPKRHLDCQGWEDELTIVTYLNPEWQRPPAGAAAAGNSGASWPLEGGETVFYDGPGADSESLGAVRPAFGRMVVFPGTLWHAGRPPTTSLGGRRFSFVTKVSPSARYARRKMAREALDVVVDAMWPRVLDLAGKAGKKDVPAQAARRLGALIAEVAEPRLVEELGLEPAAAAAAAAADASGTLAAAPLGRAGAAVGGGASAVAQKLATRDAGRGSPRDEGDQDEDEEDDDEDEGWGDGEDGELEDGEQLSEADSAPQDADEAPEGFHASMSAAQREAVRAQHEQRMYSGFRDSVLLRPGAFDAWFGRVNAAVATMLKEVLLDVE